MVRSAGFIFISLMAVSAIPNIYVGVPIMVSLHSTLVFSEFGHGYPVHLPVNFTSDFFRTVMPCPKSNKHIITKWNKLPCLWDGILGPIKAVPSIQPTIPNPAMYPVDKPVVPSFHWFAGTPLPHLMKHITHLRKETDLYPEYTLIMDFSTVGICLI